MEAMGIDVLSEELSDEGRGVYVKEDGSVVDEAFVKMIDFKIGQILEECETFFFCPTIEAFRDVSVEEYLREKFEERIIPTIDPQQQEDARLLLEWHIRFQVIDNACLSLKEVSARDWGQYSFNGENCQTHINFRNGFGQLITALVSKIAPNFLELNCEIVRIDYSRGLEDSRYKVLVEAADGRTFRARHCICTFSLGVLKATMGTLFEPQLPQPLQRLIGAYGFGTINKIYLRYDSPWWDDNWEGVQFIFDDKNENCWTRDMSGFDLLHPGPVNTLVGWIGSKGATEMEHLPDETIAAACTKLLRQFTQKNVPLPSSFFATRWTTDPFTRGAYSFTSVPKCLLRECCSLTEPLPFLHMPNVPAVLFAGEACHEKYFSTAHGAFASGIEQATKVVDLYSQFNV